MGRCWWRREHQVERGVPAAFLGVFIVSIAFRLGSLWWDDAHLDFPFEGMFEDVSHKGCVTGRPAATLCARGILSSWYPV